MQRLEYHKAPIYKHYVPTSVNAHTHIASGCNMRVMKDCMTVFTQYSDGHGWSFEAVMLSVCRPKAANATESCAKLSANEADVRTGKGAVMKAYHYNDVQTQEVDVLRQRGGRRRIRSPRT